MSESYNDSFSLNDLFTTYSTGNADSVRSEVMNKLSSENPAIFFIQKPKEGIFISPCITKGLVNPAIIPTEDNTVIFPLYFSDTESTDNSTADSFKLKPNFNTAVIQRIQKSLGLLFLPESKTGNVCFATNNADMRDEFKSVFVPPDLLNYIYAVLHAPSYRKKYDIFFTTDFPGIPYPEEDVFWPLTRLGNTLRQVHLLECPVVENLITSYPVSGNNIIELSKDSPVFTPVENGLGKVYINNYQYFDNVPETAWNFRLSGRQPAVKWLTDRKDNKLTPEDIRHYQKIIVALMETNRIEKEIDKLI